jgi:phosphoglycolate phosphatase-like HAD superfamily hydrolase
VEFAPANTWVIGDTPHDVVCARAFGARALAVATGRHAVVQLQSLQPDAVFENLADTASFWRAIGAA